MTKGSFMYRKTESKLSKKNNGFSLLETAVVLVISGLLLITLLPMYKVYQSSKNYNRTIDNMGLAQEVLREYYGNEGHYPCPANPNLPTNDPQYGVEQCRATLASPCPAGLSCITTLSRDANGDGNPDPVVIGSLPLRTLADNALLARFKVANGIDGYNTKILYSVSELMTNHAATIATPINSHLGAIDVKDENNNDILAISGSAHYVIVSHGEDRVGAYTREGVDIGGCSILNFGTGLPEAAGINNIGAMGVKVQLENCDKDDALFINSLRSMADTDAYFDDIVFFNTNSISSLWRQSSFSPPGLSYIYNTNFGAVGVGVNSPTTKLHVAGDIKAETAVEADGGALDGGYCASDGTDCLYPENLGGAGMTPCPAGEVAKGIENNQLVCAPLFLGAISFICPNAGEFVTSFTNTGTVTCAVP